MGAALEKLGEAECERIALALLQETGKKAGRRVGVHCPWHSERTPGACWYDPIKDKCTCYSCGNSGDVIDVFCQLEGLDPNAADSFRAFFQRFAPSADLARGEGGSAKKRRPQSWTPPRQHPEADNATWQDKATQWVDDCATRLAAEDLGRLMQWGVNPDTAQACGIGRQERDAFIPFSTWGLPYAENANGRERHIHLPKGFVFPVFDAEGALLRVKVRLDEPREDEPKYKAVVGGAHCYGIWGERDFRVWFIVETERDGMLLWQELAPYGIGAMATGSASHPPDAVSHAILSRADCIVNALDNDPAGAKASWGFDPTSTSFRWNTAYAHCLRWMVPSALGKDAADLVGKVNIVDWALQGLPAHVRRACLSAAERYNPSQKF